MKIIRVFWLGVKDGHAQPYDLSMGMTYDDNAGHFDLNEVYDHGVNVGQRFGQLKRKS